MKKIALFLSLALLFGVGGSVLAYEGGTKYVAAMATPSKERAEAGPVLLLPYNELAPSKPVIEFFRRMPVPTLTPERIREERPGLSRGTKPVILFQREGRI